MTQNALPAAWQINDDGAVIRSRAVRAIAWMRDGDGVSKILAVETRKMEIIMIIWLQSMERSVTSVSVKSECVRGMWLDKFAVH